MMYTLTVICACVFVLGIKRGDAESFNITTKGRANKVWGKSVDVSDLGLNVTGRASIIFKLKTCKRGGVKFLPNGLVLGDATPRLKLNKYALGSELVFANFHTCHLESTGGKLGNCPQSSHSYTGSTCGTSRPFWLRISSDGVFELGEGCELGLRPLFTSYLAPGYVLGDLELVTEEKAEWIFDDDTCSPGLDYEHPEPVYESTNFTTYANEIKQPLFAYGIDIEGRQSFVFRVKVCGTALLDIYDKDSLTDDPYYEIVLSSNNLTVTSFYTNGDCSVDTALEVDKCEGAESGIDDICQSFQTYWINLQQSGDYLIEFGKGCDIGTGILNVHRRTSPFILEDVKVSSYDDAEWVFGIEECGMEQTTQGGSDGESTKSNNDESSTEGGASNNDASTYSNDASTSNTDGLTSINDESTVSNGVNEMSDASIKTGSSHNSATTDFSKPALLLFFAINLIKLFI